MSARKVRLELWVIYDSATGYVWSQVHGTKPDFDEHRNYPNKVLRLLSDPYTSNIHDGAWSFGTEIIETAKGKKDE